MKVHPTGLLSKEQNMQTNICHSIAKKVIHTVHELMEQ